MSTVAVVTQSTRANETQESSRTTCKFPSQHYPWKVSTIQDYSFSSSKGHENHWNTTKQQLNSKNYIKEFSTKSGSIKPVT